MRARASIEIARTQRALSRFGETFVSYMGGIGRRTDIDLGAKIRTHGRRAIVVGWNGSANYKLVDASGRIFYAHPDEVAVIVEDEEED